MKTDQQLKDVIPLIQRMRMYDDETSMMIRLEMIEELNRQIKSIMRVAYVDNRKKLDYLKKFEVFHDHVANHDEVKNAPVNKGEVMCKICNKTIDEITSLTK